MTFFLIFFTTLGLSIVPSTAHGKCPCIAKNERILQQSDLNDFTKAYSNWNIETSDNHKQFSCFLARNLVESAYDIVSIAAIAERLQHHPDISITSDGIKLSIYTHAQNTLTFKDVVFVQAIENAFAGKKKKLLFLNKKSVEVAYSLDLLTFFIAENPLWNTDATNSQLLFSSNTANFEYAAKIIGQCCLLENFTQQLQEIHLSYGSCSVILQSKNGLISADTIAKAKACQSFLAQLITVNKSS